tara:strand:+ start:6471 stop:6734 length:264 start_codon:yes stop_codon:yes gene_type:complete
MNKEEIDKAVIVAIGGIVSNLETIAEEMTRMWTAQNEFNQQVVHKLSRLEMDTGNIDFDVSKVANQQQKVIDNLCGLLQVSIIDLIH